MKTNINPDKVAQAAAIAQQMEAYLSQGGSITTCKRSPRSRPKSVNAMVNRAAWGTKGRYSYRPKV